MREIVLLDSGQLDLLADVTVRRFQTSAVAGSRGLIARGVLVVVPKIADLRSKAGTSTHESSGLPAWIQAS